MLDLLAVSFEDGWAFVKRGTRILLTQPPYLGSNLSWVDETTVEKAISQYGFVTANESFEDWSTLVSFLKEKFVAARRKLGLEGAAHIEELLEHAPNYILRDYLQRVEEQLLPRREWRPALNLLTQLTRLDSVKADGELLARTLRLIAKTVNAMEEYSLQRQRLLNQEEKFQDEFPASSNKFGSAQIDNCIKSVRSRHCVWR